MITRRSLSSPRRPWRPTWTATAIRTSSSPRTTTAKSPGTKIRTAAAAFGPQQSIGQLDGAAVVVAADIDGDQDYDVVVGSRYYGTDSIVWFANDAAQGDVWPGSNRDRVGRRCRDVAGSRHGWRHGSGLGVGQFPGRRSGLVRKSRRPGAVRRQASWSPTTFRDTRPRPAGDLDGDGDVDIAFTPSTTMWWPGPEQRTTAIRRGHASCRNSGPSASIRPSPWIWTATATWTSPPRRSWTAVSSGSRTWTDAAASVKNRSIDDALPGAIHIEAADLNGDPRPDLLVSASSASARSSGTPTWARVTAGPSPNHRHRPAPHRGVDGRRRGRRRRPGRGGHGHLRR